MTAVMTSGPLATHMVRYLAHREALRKTSRNDRHTLRLLDRYLGERRIDSLVLIDGALIDAFLASRPHPRARGYNTQLGEIARFFRWLVLHGFLVRSPVLARRRPPGSPLRPFLFDQELARRLLRAAGELAAPSRAPWRPTVYRMIFILLYGLGLRVGEACRLRRADVDLDRCVLTIRNAKFGKDRLVPFGPKIAAELERFLEWRSAHPSALRPDSPVFTFDPRGLAPVYSTCVTRTFQRLLPQLHLSVPPGTRPPHLHCLRHSFAVGTLLRWYQSGVDPNARLSRLATFIGHVSPSSTAVYLTITTELLEAANERFAAFAAPVRKGAMP